MSNQQIYITNKQLDSYSMLICSKYFIQNQDFINIICVCKKFKETTEKLRYNPISITSLKLFPKIQTQYLYNESDKKINGIDKYEIIYDVGYNFNMEIDYNIKYHHIHLLHPSLDNVNGLIPLSVNSLNESCFEYNTIKSILIPNGITSIENSCFASCTQLTSIKLPPSLQTIKSECFYNCSCLKNIEIPNIVQSIGCTCFLNCESLQSITIPHSIHVLEEMLFQSCTSLSEVILPNTINSIENFCFADCSSLTTIILPSLLVSIGYNCFNDCINLKSIEIPKSVKIIEDDCFYGCSSLTNISLQSNMKEFPFQVSYNDSILYKKIWNYLHKYHSN
ncbi:hypothetical protein QTN25_001397 [Entamoeba marina]